MDSLDPDLDLLREELERLDYVVVDHGEHICVRLPLLSSVVIRHSEDGFGSFPQFGPFRRSGGLMVTSGVSTVAVAGAAFALVPRLDVPRRLPRNGGSRARCVSFRAHRRLSDATSAAHCILGDVELAEQGAVGSDPRHRGLLSERTPATVLDQPVVDQLRSVR